MPDKLAVLAGGGALPAEVIEAARRQGRDVFVVAFRDHTDPAVVEGVPHMWARLGAAGAIIDRLHAEQVVDVLMVGPVKRPSFLELRPDARTARFVARIGKRAFSGDDSLLRSVVQILEEEEGFRVLGVHDILGDALAGGGVLGRHRPDADAQADIDRGFEVAHALGLLDVGQAVVVQQGVVLGVEAAEGTDGLLARVGAYAGPGPGGVLVKASKPQQEERVDLPTIGVQTIEAASRAGLRGVAVESGGALIVDRDAVVAAADEKGLFLVAVAASGAEDKG
jgi:DUF1009 family protein